MLQVFHMKVAVVVYVCCNSIFQMFQLFHLDVACFHLDIAYVAMATHMLQVYVPNVSPLSYVRCKCSMWMLYMLQWLYTYVANVYFNYFTLFQYVTVGVAPHAL
jgi:hypothetical protein